MPKYVHVCTYFSLVCVLSLECFVSLHFRVNGLIACSNVYTTQYTPHIKHFTFWDIFTFHSATAFICHLSIVVRGNLINKLCICVDPFSTQSSVSTIFIILRVKNKNLDRTHSSESKKNDDAFSNTNQILVRQKIANIW